MSFLTINQVRLHCVQVGSGSETVVFAHGLLMDHRMFAAQMRTLADRYRVIAFDFRGQGASEEARSGYDMDTLTEDAVGVIQATGAAPCHFVGLSMGGFVGLRLAIRYPHLLRSLTVIDSSAGPEPAENAPRYRALAFIARWLGLGLVIDRVMPILFGRTFLEDPARAAERAEWRGHLRGLRRRATYKAAHGVIGREGVEADLSRIATPTLIMVGDEDVATVPSKSEAMHRAITGSELVIVPGAGHSSTLEQPELVTEALVRFLTRKTDGGADTQ